MKYLIIGGVAVGASAAARLRRLDEEAQIIIFDKGQYVSFSNCGLPYHIGGEIKNEESLILMTPEKFKAQYNIEARVLSKVKQVNPNDKKIKIKNLATNEEYFEEYDKLVIAPGARAFLPPFENIDKIDTFTLKTVPDVSNIMSFMSHKNPKHVTVIGGGFIGVEAAENFKKAGLKVTLIEGLEQVLMPLDKEMAHFIHNELLNNDVELILNKMVKGFDTKKVILKSGEEIQTDFVVVSAGVKPETEFLNSSNIEMENGYIKVDHNYKTNIDDIYAAGDAILVENQITKKLQPLALAGPANKQGRLIADAIMGKKILNKGYIGSSVIKVFDYIAASTGINEKEAKKLGLNYEVSYAAPSNIVGIMPGSTNMPIKIIYDKETGILLGGQVVAKGNADKRVDVLATAIKANMTVEDLADLELTYAPPVGTGKDVVNKIGYSASNLLNGLYRQVLFLDVYNLVKENAQIIDVREENEYNNGHIEGAKNIPMSRFRQSLDEIDKTKPVYVHCQTGQRSYNVALALKHYGFDVYNIAGSYFFTSMYEKMEQKFDNSRENILV